MNIGDERTRCGDLMARSRFVKPSSLAERSELRACREASERSPESLGPHDNCIPMNVSKKRFFFSFLFLRQQG